MPFHPDPDSPIHRSTPGGGPIWPGIAVDRLISHKWSVKEIARQLKIEESTGPRKRGGVIFWNLQALKNGTKGVDAVVAD